MLIIGWLISFMHPFQVNFLISGDLPDLKLLTLSLKERLPLIVMRGSGGAADVVAQALDYFRVRNIFDV